MAKNVGEMSPIGLIGGLIGGILIPILALGVTLYLHVDSKIDTINKNITDLSQSSSVHFQKIDDALAQADNAGDQRHKEVMRNFESVGLVTGDLKDQYHIIWPILRHKIDSLIRENESLRKQKH